MKKRNDPLRDKSYAFALKIVQVCNQDLIEKRQYVLSNQLLRAGTSIGANVEEARGAQSRREFVSKLHICYREARETHYWLRLLSDAALMEMDLSRQLMADCEELIRLLVAILKSAKGNSDRKDRESH